MNVNDIIGTILDIFLENGLYYEISKCRLISITWNRYIKQYPTKYISNLKIFQNKLVINSKQFHIDLMNIIISMEIHKNITTDISERIIINLLPNPRVNKLTLKSETAKMFHDKLIILMKNKINLPFNTIDDLVSSMKILFKKNENIYVSMFCFYPSDKSYEYTISCIMADLVLVSFSNLKTLKNISDNKWQSI